MAIPTTKSTFKDYCLRSLGDGVIDINISDDQADDRIDEAIQYFSEYHYDGVERMYLKHLITQEDIDRAITNESSSATDSVDSTVSSTWLAGKNYIPLPSSIVSVVQVFPLTGTGSGANMFDARYQLHLNELYDLSSTSVINYEMNMNNLDFLQHVLVGEQPIRFNQHQNRLFIEADWSRDFVAEQDYIVIECFRKLDPASYTDVYDDILLKRYATALIKKQWGANLSKFSGVAMLGGVTMNGETLYSQGIEEQKQVEDSIRSNEPPIMFGVG
jgi:hypothetical protein